MNVRCGSSLLLKIDNYYLTCPQAIISQGEDSQNFLHIFVRFFITLGLKILRLFRFKALFDVMMFTTV
jgi:hypothetical protein